ncbi:hypothetical protein K503DRAFT_806755 [Rhizopogon vinicolor AM-OR11-026]|uniref:Uncharacterized protein n=1 Tax=Rhizopogon vinicolor AM-OR11-026 TaxID=1314800 RepID=A0A1B7MDU1_9AGAM|nr:hypothetical protein K503DRAFT_806755 [Rhizopogon vinicolor AM-OR11-026]
METVVVMAVYSDEEDDFERRATQEKVDFIAKLIRRSPRRTASGITHHVALATHHKSDSLKV